MTDFAGVALIITAVFSGLASLGTLLTAYLATRAAAKTKEVKEELERSDRKRGKEAMEQRKIAMETHAAVNGSMTLQLKLHAGTASRLAELTGDAVDQAAAEAATKLLHDHEAQIAETKERSERPVTEGDNPTR